MTFFDKQVLLSLLYQTGPNQKLEKGKRLSCSPCSISELFYLFVRVHTHSHVPSSSPASLSQLMGRLLMRPQDTLCPSPGDAGSYSRAHDHPHLPMTETHFQGNVQNTHTDFPLFLLIKSKQCCCLQNRNPWAGSLPPCD